jgi:hypothetical protein
MSSSALGSWPPSQNKLASIDFDNITNQKVQYLPSSFIGNVLMSPPLLLRTIWTEWISGLMVIHGAAPLRPTFITIMASLLENPLVLAN